MHKLHFISAACVLTLLIFSCRKEVVDDLGDRGKSFYPYSEGLWWEYDVDSTFYNDFSGDTLISSYILREEFVSYFDSSGLSAIRIERFRRANENESWQGPRVWWTYLTEQGAVKVEENIPYVKINYPVKNNLGWNGNRLNFLDPLTYVYQNTDEPLSLNGNTFDSTVTVMQNDNETLLGKKLYYEKYARNVGLIQVEITDISGFIDSDNVADTLAKPILNRIKSGVVYSQRIRDWGTL